jgi:VWFA-related protein
MMRTKVSSKFLAVIIMGLILASSFIQAGSAQEGDQPENIVQENDIVVDINRVDSTDFPNIIVYFSVYGRSGNTIPNITAENIVVKENQDELADPFRLNEVLDIKTPLAISLLIDTSGSMEGPRLDRVLPAAGRFVQNLRPDDMVGLISFNDVVIEKQPLTGETSLVVNALSLLETGGNSTLYDALYEGIEMVKTSEFKKAVVVITDGYDAMLSEKSLADVIQFANEWNVPIYTIGFGRELISESGVIAKYSRLDELSAETGGFSTVYQNADEVSSGLDKIDSLLRTSYEIKYQSNLPDENQDYAITIDFSYMDNTYSGDSSFIPNPISLKFVQPTLSDSLSINSPIYVETYSSSKIAHVKILVEGSDPIVLSATGPDRSTFQGEWDLRNTIPGEHSLTAVATDTQGNSKKETITVVVRNPLIIEIEIISSEETTKTAIPQEVQVKIDSYLDFSSATVSINDEVIDTFTGENEFSIEWPTQFLQQGLFNLSVTAKDVDDNSVTEEIQVEISGPPKSSLGFNDDLTRLLLVIFGGVVVLVAILLITVPAIIRKKKRKIAQGMYHASAAPQLYNQPVSPTGSSLSLQEISGENPGEVWPIGAYEIKFGRKKEDNDIPLKGETASRRMAIIQLTQNGLMLHSLRPENPVKVNGRPVQAQIKLKPGDEITMGESKFKIISS